jgi:hypothetical protein
LAESSLLSALLANESGGGHNIANTHEGTSSGQAQGYFQITTGTWDEFGGQQYASNPLNASYAQQAAIASKIPLSRWDSSTLARMRATGFNINPHATLGENLASNGESFSDFNPGTGQYAASKGAPKGAPIAVAGAQTQPQPQPQTAAPPSMTSMIGQALGGIASPGGGGGMNNAMLAQAAPPAPGPQMAFRAAADDAAQASNLTAGGPPGAGAAAQPGAGPGGMTGLLGLMADPTAQSQVQLPTDTPMVGMSGLLYGGGAGLGVRHPAVTRLT